MDVCVDDSVKRKLTMMIVMLLVVMPRMLLMMMTRVIKIRTRRMRMNRH